MVRRQQAVTPWEYSEYPSEYSEYPDGSTQNGIGRILELAVRPRLGRRRAKHADDAEALAQPKQLKQPEAL